MIYLLYEDTGRWKVAMSDGHLDMFTVYYASFEEATGILAAYGINYWLSELVEPKLQKLEIIN